MKRVFRAVWIPAILVVLAGCGGARPEPQGPVASQPFIRVGVVAQATEVELSCETSFTITGRDGHVVSASAKEPVYIRRVGDRLVVRQKGTDRAAAGPLQLAPELATRSPKKKPDVFLVDGRRYPGRIRVSRSSRQGLNVVNILDVEEYLRGVVPMEIGHQRPGDLEAAKAQAVAARTYVAGHLNQYPEEGYDLVAGVRDQVYGPLSQRHPNSDRAVAETRGLILHYDGKPIRANYASTCGGRTAAVEESFDIGPLPYLRSQKDNRNGEASCRTSKYFRWTQEWSGEELLSILSRTVPAHLGTSWAGKEIRRIDVLERGRSGRVTRLALETDAGRYEVQKGTIRQVLARDLEGRGLRSTAFELDVKKSGGRVERVTARGRGWGHGVGMCQWGAMQLSREGTEFESILDQYYPGTQLVVWDGTLAGRRVRATGGLVDDE